MGQQSPSPGDEDLARQREAELMAAMLEQQVGIGPHRLGPVLDLAAVGMANGVWRNGSVENWHAGGGPLDDGAMLRLNAHTTWRLRQILRRWRGDQDLTADDDAAEALEELDVEAVWWLASRVYRWMTRPGRVLPIGMTVAELAGEEIGEFAEHADGALTGFAASAEEYGVLFAFWRVALHGGLACGHWWGTPAWPGIVDSFCRVLDDPHREHWGPSGDDYARLSPSPETIGDRGRLRRTLLHRPWDLDPHAANWLLSAGLGSLRPARPTISP